MFEIPDFLKWTYSLFSLQPHKIPFFFFRLEGCRTWRFASKQSTKLEHQEVISTSLILLFICLVTWDETFHCSVYSTHLWCFPTLCFILSCCKLFEVVSVSYCVFVKSLQHLTVCLWATENEGIFWDDKKVEDACLKGLNVISSWDKKIFGWA